VVDQSLCLKRIGPEIDPTISDFGSQQGLPPQPGREVSQQHLSFQHVNEGNTQQRNDE
jgi:hypothetical protein